MPRALAPPAIGVLGVLMRGRTGPWGRRWKDRSRRPRWDIAKACCFLLNAAESPEPNWNFRIKRPERKADMDYDSRCFPRRKFTKTWLWLTEKVSRLTRL